MFDDFSDFIDFLKFLFWIAAICSLAALVLGGTIAGLVFLANGAECYSYAAATGEHTRMIFMDCYVQEGNKWVTLDSHTANHHVEVKQ